MNIWALVIQIWIYEHPPNTDVFVFGTEQQCIEAEKEAQNRMKGEEGIKIETECVET